MRKIILLLLCLFIFNFMAFAQTIIENPKKPLSRNAGRVLKLEEVFRITDERENFYLKSPGNLKLSSDGFIYIKDMEQLLKFSSEGKFIKNLFKKGQGPGEVSTAFSYSYSIYKDEIYIYDRGSNKIIRTDLNGNMTEEKRLKTFPGSFLYITDHWLIFWKQIWPPQGEWKSQIYDLKNNFILVSKEEETEKKIHDFPTKMFLAPRAASSWTNLYWILDNENEQLYISHTGEYLIKSLDLEKGEITRSFRRKYPRVKYEMKEWDKKFYKLHHPPKKKFESDVLGLFVCDGFLWVKTSTKYETKGILIDVFNKEGKYVDNFYLNHEGSLMAAHGDFIFVKETDEDENIQIVKYKIVE